MRRTNRSGVYLFSSLIVMIAMLFCFTSVSFSEPLGEPIRIGVAAPFSGPAAPWGNATLRPAQLYAEEVNAKGGVVAGGKRHMVELIYYDHKYRADEAATVVRRLILKDKVTFITNLGGGVMPAITGIIQDNPVICFGGTFGLGIVRPENTHIFVTVSQPIELTYVYKWFAENRPGIKKVACVAPNDMVGRTHGKMLEMRTKAYGLTCVGVEYYERGMTDFTALLSRLMANNPDIIDVDGSAPGTTGTIIKQAKELGFKGDVFHGGLGDANVVMKMLGPEQAEGFYSNCAIPPGFEDHIKKYTAKFGEWDTMSPVFGRYAYIFVEAIKRAGSLDFEKVMSTVESPDFTWDDQLGGKGRFYGKDEPLYGISHQVLVPEHLGQVRKGKFEYVTKYGSPLLPK